MKVGAKDVMTRLFLLKNLLPSKSFLSKGYHVLHQHEIAIRSSTVVQRCHWKSPRNRNIATSCQLLSGSGKPDDDFNEVERPPKPHPFDRTLKILKHDLKSLYDPSQPKLQEFSSHVDILIIGGGVMGSSIAHAFKERTPRKALSTMVIEKDPTYSQSATVMSVGGLRHHFSLRDNIQMAQYSAEFLRQVPKKLECEGEAPPDIQFHPYGYLQLADEEHAQDIQESFLLQKEVGCHVELLTPERLKDKFPWMNTQGVELACYGVESEGWFDAWAFHFGLKRKAIHLGTEYIHAEVVGFEFERSTLVVAGHDTFDDLHHHAKRVIVKTPTGELKTIDYAYCIIAAGHESGNIAEMARIGRGPGLLSVQLPVEPRKRNVYCIHAPEGPGIDCPIVADTNGTYFRREGYAGNFVAGHSPPLGEKPDTGDLEVDYSYFDNIVWPSISHRVPGFKNIKLNSAWTGYYDYNRFDQNGIIGPHPYYPNIYFACGFSGHGIQQAPAVARAIMELILDGEFRTIDLTKYLFERLYLGIRTQENIVN